MSHGGGGSLESARKVSHIFWMANTNSYQIFFIVSPLSSCWRSGTQVVQLFQSSSNSFVPMLDGLRQRVQLGQDRVRLSVRPPLHRVHLHHQLLHGPVEVLDAPQFGLHRGENDLEHADQVAVAERIKKKSKVRFTYTKNKFLRIKRSRLIHWYCIRGFSTWTATYNWQLNYI